MINKIKTKSGGYSLVEMLVVMFLFSMFAILVTQSLSLVIRGNKKNENISEIKQNLDYVYNVMERRLRNAQNFDTTACTGQSLTYVLDNGSQESFSCNNSDVNDQYIQHSTLGRLSGETIQIVNCTSIFNCIDDKNVDVTITGEDKFGTAVGASETITTRFLIRD